MSSNKTLARPTPSPSSPQIANDGAAISAARMAHFGDPCIHCGIAWDEVESGPCHGDPAKVIVTGYWAGGVRSDGVETYHWQTSDGERHSACRHVSEHAPYYHFGKSDTLINPPPYRPEIKGAW